MQQEHYCYILFNDAGKTYNGCTIHLEKRLRQHNGEICGGARYTTRICKKHAQKWRYLICLTSTSMEFDKKRALSLEWSIKNPTNRKTRPCRTPSNRIASLDLVFTNPKFQDLSFVVTYCDDKYKTHLEPILEKHKSRVFLHHPQLL